MGRLRLRLETLTDTLAKSVELNISTAGESKVKILPFFILLQAMPGAVSTQTQPPKNIWVAAGDGDLPRVQVSLPCMKNVTVRWR